MISTSSRYIEKRATYVGFSIYVLLVFIFPFILLTAARLGDHALMHNYIVPFSDYKFILIILSGLFTGLISKNHPFVNSVFVGLLGLLVWLIFSSLSASMADRVVSIQTLFSQSIIRVSWCAAGGLCVALYRVALVSFNASFKP